MSARGVTVRAAAKINLLLGVGAVRPDGFHPLSTVYQAIGLYDDVTVHEADEWTVSVVPTADIDCSDVPLDDRNIAVRAGRLLAHEHGLMRAAEIRIAKGIPVAGGLAGGSADAAATLVALDRLWGLDTTDDVLLRIAGELGSDVPFALLGGTAHGSGRGEVVQPATDHGEWWWVVIPDETGLSTATVYQAYDEMGLGHDLAEPTGLLAALESGDADALVGELANDLTTPALELRPDLAHVPDLLRGAGARAALLSGSGPTWLGLATDADHAREIAEGLLDAVPRVFLAPGPVAGAHVVEYS